MKNVKVWAVLGAGKGLGPAATRYLVAHNQLVVALVLDDSDEQYFFDNKPSNLVIIHVNPLSIESVRAALEKAMAAFGPIHFMINNANYQLFNTPVFRTDVPIRNTIAMHIAETMALVKTFLPYLNEEPRGSIINIPPQLCLATIPDQSVAMSLSSAMELFLGQLHQELAALDCGLTFLEPGERLPYVSI